MRPEYQAERSVVQMMFPTVCSKKPEISAAKKPKRRATKVKPAIMTPVSIAAAIGPSLEAFAMKKNPPKNNTAQAMAAQFLRNTTRKINKIVKNAITI